MLVCMQITKASICMRRLSSRLKNHHAVAAGPSCGTGTALEDIFQSLLNSGGASDSDDSDSEQHVAPVVAPKEPVRQPAGLF